MKANLKKFRRNIVVLIMSLIVAVSMCGISTVFAAEYTNAENDCISSMNLPMPRAGTEILPKGIYFIGGFTFTNDNLTPVKTVEGSKIAFSISFRKASIDTGIGNVKLKFQVRDINGSALSPVMEEVANTDGSVATLATDYIDLGYPGRKIQLWMDASSTGTSNGNYRSIEIYNWCSFVE